MDPAAAAAIAAPGDPGAPVTGDPATPPATDPATPPVVDPNAPKPLEYEIELREDSPLTDEEAAEIVKFAEANSLTKEQTEAIIAQREGTHARAKAQADQAFQAQLQARAQELNALPEFSGEQAKNSWAYVSKAVEVFGNAAVVEKMKKDPQVAYDKDLALMLRDIGKALYGDQPLPGSGTATPTNAQAASDEDARLRRLYPSMYPAEK